MTPTSPATNSTYPKVAVQWLNQSLCYYQSLCLVDSEVLRNRHLRVAAKRWAKGAKPLCPIGAPFAQLHAWSKLTSLTPSARLLCVTISKQYENGKPKRIIY